MKKKLTLSIVLLVALAVVMSLTVFVSNVKAETPTAVVDGITYTYEVNANNANEVTITGYTGTLPATYTVPATLGEKTVTAIGDEAFYTEDAFTTVTNLTIPDSVKTIGVRAFARWEGITAIDLGKVEVFEEGAFQMGDTVFTQNVGLELPAETTKIGNKAFMNWRGETSLVIPNKVTEIGEFAFYKCRYLASVTIGSGVTSIGKGVFAQTGWGSEQVYTVDEANTTYYSENNCIIKTADKTLVVGGISSTIPADVKAIGDYAFSEIRYLPNNFIIPNSVETIGDHAFYACYANLTTISVNCDIGENAFNGCTGLTSVTIGANVETIGDYAFSGCTALATLNFAEGSNLETIGDYAFSYEGSDSADKTAIVSLTLPDGLKHIGDYAFGGISRLLHTLEIPDSVTYIGDYAFSRITNANKTGNASYLTELDLPDNLEYIGAYAFYNYRVIRELTIPDSVKRIGDYAFYNSYALESLTLGDGLESIGNFAFSQGTNSAFHNNTTGTVRATLTLPTSGNLKSIGEKAFENWRTIIDLRIPASVTEIGSLAFHETRFMETIVVEEGNPVYHSSGNCLIETSSKKIIVGAAYSDIPHDGSVTTIGEYAFYNKKSLTAINIPASVATIERYAFHGSTLATIYCESADQTGITYSGNGHTVEQGAAWSYSRCMGDHANQCGYSDGACDVICNKCLKANGTNTGEHTVVDGVCSVCNTDTRFSYSLYGSNEIKINTITPAANIVIPATIEGKNVKVIGYHALWNDNSDSTVTTLTIPNTVVTIEEGAFANNRAVTILDIPDSVVTIGKDAFWKCQGLTSLEIGSSVISIGERAFGRTPNLTTITISGNNNDYFAVQNDCLVDVVNKTVLTAKAQETITIPEGIEVIGTQAFYNNSVVRNVTFPSTLNKIAEEAFYGAKPTSVVLTNVKEIGYNAFYGDTLLTSLDLGNVETIGYQAFRGCTGLTSVVIPETTKTIGYNAFYGCSALRTVVIPKSVTEIGYGAFVNCGLSSANNANVYYEGTREEFKAINWTLNPDKGTTQNNDVLLDELDNETTRAYKHYNTCMHGENYVHTAEWNGTTATCANCDNTITFEFAAASVTLESNLAINYKVSESLVEFWGLKDTIGVAINFNNTTLNPTASDKGQYYVYTLADIAPDQIATISTATLSAGDNLEYSHEYSVAQYCYNQLNNTANAEKTELLTLLVDLLNYGSAAQTYVGGYDVLANANLTEAQQAYGTQELRTLVDSTDLSTGLEGATATWLAASLRLEDAVTLRFKFAAESIEGLKVKIEVDGKEKASLTEFVETNGGYYVYFDGFDPSEMSTEVNVTVCDSEGTAVSETLTYSIESYAANKAGDDALGNLVAAMMKYGDAAKAYVTEA